MAERVLKVLRWRCALVIGAAVVLAAPAAGQTLSERLMADARDARLDDLDFISAALIASGVEDECELSGWLDGYANKRLQALAAVSSAPWREQTRSMHEALHGQLLAGGYKLAASDLRRALTEGEFNCLSAAAIYYDLCSHAGIELRIWHARGHVNLCTATDDSVVIEPGASQWTESGGRSGCRRITPVELLGKFYYNRGVGLLHERRFAEGLELLQISLALDPGDDDARANLVAGLNNWAVEHYRARRYGEAAPLIEQGLRLDPLFAPLVANERLVRAKLGQ